LDIADRDGPSGRKELLAKVASSAQVTAGRHEVVMTYIERSRALSNDATVGGGFVGGVGGGYGPGRVSDIPIIQTAVEIEGPIHQEEVARRVAKAFGLEKAGARIQTATFEGLKFANGLSVENNFWSIEGDIKKVVRNRSNVVNKNLEKAEFLPPSEIRVALEHLVKSSVQIEDAELIQQVSRLFGFQRCGPDLKIVIQKILDQEVGKIFARQAQYISLIK
jgi:hypothetical protein